MLTKEDARRVVNENQPTFLEKAKKTGYICPRCENGRGKDGTGITKDPKTGRWHCFKCDLHEDIVGLWATHKNLTDQGEIFRSLYNYFNLQVEDGTQNQPKNERKTAAATAAYFTICAENASKTDYFQRRGISAATVDRHKLGYDPAFKTAGGTWKAVIIPTDGGSYVARNTDPNAGDSDRFRKHGPAKLYLAENLQRATEPIFICEGEMDALSFDELGAAAVGLGSISNIKLLLEMVKEKKPVQPLILALDNDESGWDAAEKLEKELDLLGIICFRHNPYGDHKDANDALKASRADFRQGIETCIEDVTKEIELKTEQQREEYYKNSAAGHLTDFLNAIHTVNTPCTPTKFYRLDALLDGGLYEGLYVLGAVSSVGKTTFALQLADQIAQQGKSVLFFSLEMARSELMAKSISRLTLLDIVENGGDRHNAKTDRGITTHSRYEYYSQLEKELIKRAIEKYSGYARNIFIHEGIGNIGTPQIRQQIERHYSFTGEYPIVFIDYIQILAPADIRATDKQNIDKAVLELKRISRDYKIPVVGISSFNRASYKEGAAMDSFKESGALEYGSDVLMGLQLEGMGRLDKDAIAAARREETRKMELVILKNRHGDAGEKVRAEFDYFRLFNYFKETGPDTVNIMPF